MGMPALDLAADQPPHTQELLRALIANLSAQAPRASELPTLEQLAVERPERLPSWRVEAIRGLSTQLRITLDHLGEGRDNDDIAYRMRIAKDTVETHCRALRSRLQVRTRAELMALAGLLSAVRPDADAIVAGRVTG